MRKTCLALLSCLLIGTTVPADTITQWNFNSNPPDSTSNTGTNVPSMGTGTISVIGTVIQNASATQEYSSAEPTATDRSTDPATGDDSAYHTRNYPLQGDSNKTSGIEVRVSTVGYEKILVSWDQRNSATVSKYLRFQYSLDGSTFVDYVVLRMDVLTFVNGRTVDLTPILGANGNPNFAFRLVSEFESTATGSGAAGFVSTGSGTYSPNGTMRFDMLTVSGSLPDGNAFPTISSIENQTIRVDTATDALRFQVGDVETPADQLLVTGTSSNPTLVSDAGILIEVLNEGEGAKRTVTVQPNFDQIGTATITLWVVDGGAKSNSTSFVLTVLPNNTPPSLSTFTNVHTVKNTPFAPLTFTVSDAEQPVDSLGVTAVSSDQSVIPDENLVISESGANRTLTITPAPDAVGTAVITITVGDGFLSTNRTFNAMIVSSGNIVFSEPFNYADGPLLQNSGQLWITRAGIPNQMQLLGGEVQVTASQTEDVMATLIGAPYNVNGSAELYASFDVTFSGLPTSAPDFFAHFAATADSGDLRGRVLASTRDAAPGTFRLGVANSTSTAANVADYPVDLTLDTPIKVVVAYDVATGSSKLWVNPASGGAPVDAIDAAVPIPINFFALRQNSGIGRLRVDNLLVGLTYEDVTPYLTRVHIRRAGNAVQVYWPSGGIWSGFVLESTPSLENPDWQPVNQATVPIDGWDTVTIENPTENQFFRLRNSL